MKQKPEIYDEINRVKDSRDKFEDKGDDAKASWLNSRYWALKWVLGEEE